MVREHYKTNQTRKIWKIRTKTTKKPTGVLKNLMQEDQKGCKNKIRAEEERITAARAKHEDEEEDTGIRPGKKYPKKKKWWQILPVTYLCHSNRWCKWHLFVREGTSVVYLEPACINEGLYQRRDRSTRNRTRRYFNLLARIFRASFVWIIAYS